MPIDGLQAHRQKILELATRHFGVNLEIVWAVVQKELPKLKVAIASLLTTGEVR